jgi:hypothetical protein
MHHFLSKPDWLEDLNTDLAKRNVRIALDFDRDFVLVANDWASGFEPEDVADAIAAGTHKHIPLRPADTSAANA